MKSAIAKVISTACIAALAGCGGEQFGDLKRELADATKDFRGRVETLPQVRPYEPVKYDVEGILDPFRPERIVVAQAGRSGGPVSKLAPDMNRPREPLEAFPLESLRMVGTIKQEQQVFGLIRAGANLFRVRKGDYMGQNFGVVTVIDESQINLKEIVQDGAGEWVERTSSISLQEAGR